MSRGEPGALRHENPGQTPDGPRQFCCLGLLSSLSFPMCKARLIGKPPLWVGCEHTMNTCAGAAPNVSPARACGLHLGASHSARPHAHLETLHPVDCTQAGREVVGGLSSHPQSQMRCVCGVGGECSGPSHAQARHFFKFVFLPEARGGSGGSQGT